MRWENLSLDHASKPLPDALPLALPANAVVRTFDTPGFAGMTFYEIQARSIISRVPSASRMPFEWTINPYRGCSHACVYCLAGDTPVLRPDGSYTRLAELGVGDAVVGTVPDLDRRRCVTTVVRAHWRTVKPAHRVTLDDGTELVASAEHRFLTDRGWAHVASGHPGQAGLTAGDKLVGADSPAGGRTGGYADRLRAVVAVEALGAQLPMFDITTGTGDFIAAGVVSHNCFARNTHTYLDLDAGLDFDRKVVVKVNAPTLLRKALAAPNWAGGHIAMGTNVDCYQRAEGRYQLMRGILAALRDHANPFSILTKGTLITRDLDLLSEAAQVTSVGVSFSVGFVDQDLWRTVEPGTPSPRRRLAAVRQFVDAGFEVTVLMAPILPGLTDTEESINATVAAIAAAGATGVVPLTLHLRPGAREWYGAWLAREHPALADRYRALYPRGSYAPQAYQREVAAKVAAAARSHGIGRPHMSDHRRLRAPTTAADPGHASAAEQLTLL
ncbi:MAG TPA: Rv2578c family radical SAM protein [Micromonosporaceae bacterium]